jgi:multidrug resistance protein
MSFAQIISKPGMKPVLFTMFMASFGFGVVLPIIPFYALALGATPFELGLLTAVFAFTSLIFSPPLGRLSDRIGRRKMLLIGTVGFAFSYVMLAYADTLALAFASRAIGGLFAAAMFPSGVSLISDLTTERERGQAMALYGMAFAFGMVVGPAFGGIASAISVRDAFLLSAAFSLANTAFVWLRLKEPREKAETRAIPQQEASLLSHLTSPLAFLFASSFMVTFVIGGLDAVLALYTGEKLGFSSPQIGLVFTYLGIAIIALQLASGSLVNRLGEVRMIQLGLALIGIGFFSFVFVSDWLTLLLPLTVLVTGNVLVNPAVGSLMTKKVKGKKGAVLGLDSSSRSLGQVIGPLFGGLAYGINHYLAFAGMAAVVIAYLAIFTFGHAFRR